MSCPIIFIFSVPRSGSTLLQRLLGEHPDIFTDVESWFLLHPIYALREKGITTEYGHTGAQRALNHYLNNFAEGNKTFYQAVASYYNTLCDSALTKTNKRFFLDKTPPYTRIIKEIASIFPDAKYIFLTRNPLSNLYSVLTTWTKKDWGKLYWSSYDLLHAPLDLIDGYDSIASKSILVTYENLVARTEETLTDIYRYLELQEAGIITTYLLYNRPKDSANALFIGDPENVDKFSKPEEAFSNKWLSLAKNPQTLHFADAYLDALGEQLLQRLGYSMEQLRETLHLQAKDYRDATWTRYPIVPWDIATKPPIKRTRKEHLQLKKQTHLQKFGYIKGYPLFLTQNVAEILKSLVRQ